MMEKKTFSKTISLKNPKKLASLKLLPNKSKYINVFVCEFSVVIYFGVCVLKIIFIGRSAISDDLWPSFPTIAGI